MEEILEENREETREESREEPREETREEKLKTILSELSKERELSYRKGSIPLTDQLDSTTPLSNIIIESFHESHELDTGKAVGKEKFKNGGEYKGDIGDNHMMHGSGQYRWPDGLIYKGEFTDCHITGEGSYQWPDGSSYTGQVVDGLRNGWGCYKCAGSNVVYTGEWKDGKRHGKGKIVYDEEGTSYYEGDWKDHLRHGKGYRRYSSGNVYEGEWYNDKPHGLGTMYWHTTNEQYTGQWRCGIQDGHGEHLWFMEQTDNSQYPLCNRHVGNWSNGVRHGFGTFYYASGGVYEGEWHHNKKHGKGWYMSQTGVVTGGLFRDDQLVGEGLCRPVTPISRLTGGGAHTGSSDDKNSECGSNTAKFIEHIKPLLPDGLCVETEFQQVYFVILRHISQLKKVYHYYSNLGLPVDSEHPYCQKSLCRIQLWQLLKDCQLCQIGCNLIEVDNLLLLQDYSPTSRFSQHDPNSTYLMREFLQLLVSVSHNLFWTNVSEHSSGQLAQCLDKLLTVYILKHACKVEGLFYQPDSSMHHMILSNTYQMKFWEVYQIIGSKEMVSMRDFLLMMTDCGVIGTYLSSSNAIEYITFENSRASTDPPHCYNLEVLITYLEFCEGLIRCALRWQSRHNHPSTIMSPTVPSLKVESTHSNTSDVGSSTQITQKSSHGLTGNKQLAQGLPAHRANSGISIESASSLSGKRAATHHPPAVTTTVITGGKGESKTDMSLPLKIPSKHSMSLALSPIEEAKSKTSVVNTATPGPPDESDEKGSHDQPNTPNEQDEMTMCQEAIKIILEEYIFPHYGITLT